MRISPAADSELIARAQRGDVEAFCLLAANHHRSLYLLGLKFSGNHHDAEDLTQEVMLNAFRSIRQFKGISSFRTWLSRIMVNTFLNQKRKNDPLMASRRQETSEEAFEASWGIARAPYSVERDAHNSLLAQQVLEMLEAIPPRQRLMFLMKHQQGLTCEEIAELMGTSVGTVKKTLFRVVDRLRRQFAPAVPMRSVGVGRTGS
jgi:RNA polymerase sigma-70 factor (ECF subfamily)